SSAIHAASRLGSWSAAKSATIRSTRASNVASQPNSSAYSSPCASTTQPRSPGRPNLRISIAPPPTDTTVSVRQDGLVAEEVPSARRVELVDATYAYALENGLAGASLRPVAEAIGSSTGVLRFLFGSKDGLVRAVLARARQDELEMLERLPRDGD